jgi:hypothetical protein
MILSPFPDAPVTARIDGNGSGYPLLDLEAKVFTPGAHLIVRIGLRPLCLALLAKGYREVDVSFDTPSRDRRELAPSAPEHHWAVIDCAAAPHGQILFSPRRERSLAVLALLGVASASELIMVGLISDQRRSSRPVRMGLAVVAVSGLLGYWAAGLSVPFELRMRGTICGLAQWIIVMDTLIASAAVLVIVPFALRRSPAERPSPSAPC